MFRIFKANFKVLNIWIVRYQFLFMSTSLVLNLLDPNSGGFVLKGIEGHFGCWAAEGAVYHTGCPLGRLL